MINMTERVILHSDCNSFFASVEEALNPKLKKYPMAVCGSVENRHGIILAKNQIAKKYNIVTAETVVEAKRKCPELVLVEAAHHKYAEYSKAVNRIYHTFTDLVEPFGIDESWLDVSGSRLLFGDGRTIADELRRTVKRELGITVSVGVSYNKIFAKMGSDYKKPDAITEITKENYSEILFPLPVSDMFMVGRNTAEELHRMGIKTIGELAVTPCDFLVHKLGKMGETLHLFANGLDFSPVIAASYDDIPKSVGNGMTFKRDLVTREDMCAGAVTLSDEVSTRLRKYGLKAGTVHVTLKNNGFKTFSKQKMLLCPTNGERDIYNEAMSVIDMIWKKGVPIRSMTVTCTNFSVLSHCGEQLEMFTDNEKIQNFRKRGSIDGTVDNLRSKYGRDTLSYASLLNNDIGV